MSVLLLFVIKMITWVYQWLFYIKQKDVTVTPVKPKTKRVEPLYLKQPYTLPYYLSKTGRVTRISTSYAQVAYLLKLPPEVATQIHGIINPYKTPFKGKICIKDCTTMPAITDRVVFTHMTFCSNKAYPQFSVVSIKDELLQKYLLLREICIQDVTQEVCNKLLLL